MPFECHQQPDRHQFAGVQLGMWMLDDLRFAFHSVIDMAKKVNDNVFGRHVHAPMGLRHLYWQRVA